MGDVKSRSEPTMILFKKETSIRWRKQLKFLALFIVIALWGLGSWGSYRYQKISSSPKNPKAESALTIRSYIREELRGKNKQSAERNSGFISCKLCDAMYAGLRLFILEGHPDTGPMPWQLEVSRFCAPIAAAFGIMGLFAFITSLFYQTAQTRRIAKLKGHIVVCGLSQKGMHFAKEFNGRGPVVVVELNESHENIPSCHALGIQVLIGDATEKSILRSVGIQHAKYVLIVCGDDLINLQIGEGIYDLLNELPKSSTSQPCCRIHIVDAKLASIFKEHKMFQCGGDDADFRMFNNLEVCARLALEDIVLQWRPITRDHRRSVHLVMIGFGWLGREIVLEAARTWHFTNLKRTRITVVDRLIERRKAGFLSHYPAILDICDITFMNRNIEDISLIDELQQYTREPEQNMVMMVALGNELQNITTALFLSSRFGPGGPPIYVRIAAETKLLDLLKSEEEKEKWASNVRIFGSLEKTCCADIVVDENLDLLARKCHHVYMEEQEDKGVKLYSKASMQPWNELAATFRESSRYQARHIPIKAWSFSMSLSAIDAIDQNEENHFSESEKEILSELEHRRWMAYTLLDGYVPGPYNPAERTHDCLIPWDQLTEAQKDIDRKHIELIPKILKKAGLKLVRRGSFSQQRARNSMC